MLATRERLEHRQMRCLWLVQPGENCIDSMEPALRRDDQMRPTLATSKTVCASATVSNALTTVVPIRNNLAHHVRARDSPQQRSLAAHDTSRDTAARRPRELETPVCNVIGTMRTPLSPEALDYLVSKARPADGISALPDSPAKNSMIKRQRPRL
jgi:hypothetical protein